VGLIKSESGSICTDFTVNYSGQLTRITAGGIYTGTVTANQVVVSSTDNLDDRLVTINNSIISLSSTTSNHSNSITTNTNNLTALGSRVTSVETANGTQNTRLTNIEAGQITLSSNTAGVIAGLTLTSSTLMAQSGAYGIQISGNPSAVPIWVGNSTYTTPVFTVDWAGKLTATNADITGKVTAASGVIGGWTISSAGLQSEGGGGVMLFNTASSNADWLYAGPSWGTYNFRVTRNGTLYATNANITGAITATSGTFSGTVVANSIIQSSTITANSNSSIAGSLNSTTGRHNGTQYGTTYGSLSTNSGSFGGSLNSTTGSHNGSLNSSSGYLASILYEQNYERLRFYGTVRSESFYTLGTVFYGALSSLSDIRKKTNVELASSEFADFIYKVPIITYELKERLGEQKIGINATELNESDDHNIKRYLVSVDNEGFLNADYSSLHTMSVLAIQDINNRLKKIEGQLL
jgi:hypothetical protein